MKKNQMNAAIDGALAEKIQLLVNDPDFPDQIAGASLSAVRSVQPKSLVRMISEHWGPSPDAQPLVLLWMLAAHNLHEYAHLGMRYSDAGVEYDMMRDYANGFWDRAHALESPVDVPMLHRVHLYASLFGLDEEDLKQISDMAVEYVESLEDVEIDYRSWQVAQGLAA